MTVDFLDCNTAVSETVYKHEWIILNWRRVYEGLIFKHKNSNIEIEEFRKNIKYKVLTLLKSDNKNHLAFDNLPFIISDLYTFVFSSC